MIWIRSLINEYCKTFSPIYSHGVAQSFTDDFLCTLLFHNATVSLKLLSLFVLNTFPAAIS